MPKVHQWLRKLESYGIVVIEEDRGRKYGWRVAFKRDRREWNVSERFDDEYSAREAASTEDYLARLNREGDPQGYLIAPPLTWSNIEDGRQADHQAASQTSVGQVVRQTPANLTTGRTVRQIPADPAGLVSAPCVQPAAAPLIPRRGTSPQPSSFPNGEQVHSPAGNELGNEPGNDSPAGNELIPQRGMSWGTSSFPNGERTPPENGGATHAHAYTRDAGVRGLADVAKLGSEANQVLSEEGEGPCAGLEPEAKPPRRHARAAEVERLNEELEMVMGSLWLQYRKAWQGKCRIFPEAVWEALAELKVREEHPTLPTLKKPGAWLHDAFKRIIGEQLDRSPNFKRSAVATRQLAETPRAAALAIAPPTTSGISPAAPAPSENAPPVQRATERPPSEPVASSITSALYLGGPPDEPSETLPSWERCRELMAGVKAQLAKTPAASSAPRPRYAASPKGVSLLQPAKTL